MDRPSPTGYQTFFTLVTHGPFCFTGSTYLITTRAIDYGFTARVEPTRLRHHRWRVGPHVQCSRKRALAPCELLRCIRAPPRAGRTRTLGCSTLRRNTDSQSYNNQISYGSTEAESPAGPARHVRALTSASRNASQTGPDQRKSHTNAAPQRGITVHSTIKLATVPQRQARRA